MQSYLAIYKVSLSKASLNLTGCTDAVYEWLLHNSGSQPRQVKSGYVGIAQRVGKLKQCASVAVAGVQIALTDHVKSPSVTFDSHLSFDKHVNNICYACYFHIRGLWHVCSPFNRYHENHCMWYSQFPTWLLQHTIRRHVRIQPGQTSISTCYIKYPTPR